MASKKEYTPAELDIITDLINTNDGSMGIVDGEWDYDAMHSLANRGIIELDGEDEDRIAILIVDPTEM